MFEILDPVLNCVAPSQGVHAVTSGHFGVSSHARKDKTSVINPIMSPTISITPRMAFNGAIIALIALLINPVNFPKSPATRFSTAQRGALINLSAICNRNCATILKRLLMIFLNKQARRSFAVSTGAFAVALKSGGRRS